MKGFRLQVLGYSLCLLFLLSTVTCNLSTAQAAESSPSVEVKQKLEQLKQEIASKAAKLKLEISSKLTNKVYIGVIKSVSPTSITLATKVNTKIVTINQDTLFKDTKNIRKKINLSGLKEEDYIVALGDIDDTEVLTAKKIILLPQAAKEEKQKTILWGKIVSVSDKLIAIKDKQAKTISVTTSKIDVKFKSSDTVILTGFINKNGILDGSFLYVVEASPSGKFSEEATSSDRKKN